MAGKYRPLSTRSFKSVQIPKRIPPGSTLGVLGTGQLGRMFCQAARRYGYNTVCWGPPGISPCTGVADCILQADWQDREAFSEFCAKCIAVTVELEQVCPDLLERIEQRLPLQPSWETVFVVRTASEKRTGFTDTAFRQTAIPF